jgi:hypothetical protein
MAGGKKKKAADRKKADTGGQAESDRRLQYQTATTNAMQQASSRAMQAHETQLDQPNPYVQALQSRPDQHVQSQQTDRAIKKENGDDSGDSVSHQNPETDEESEWEDEEQEEGAPHPKARPNRKNRGLVRWSGMYLFLVLLVDFQLGIFSASRLVITIDAWLRFCMH